MTVWIALGLGLFIGAFLGALGGGGAILTVPALVYLLQQSAQDATTSSLIIVGAAAVTGMIGYARHGQVRWKLGLVFGAAGIVTAYAGSALNRQVDPHYLLIGFALVMLAAAAAMLLRSRNRSTVDPAKPSVDLPTKSRWFAQPAIKIILAGLGVGFLTGFFGVGGGFVIVPVLVLVFGLPMTVAAATSLLIIALNSMVSLGARVSTAHFNWAIIVPFAISAMLASLAGKRIAGRLPDQLLTRVFAGMLIAIGVFVGVQNVTALA